MTEHEGIDPSGALRLRRLAQRLLLTTALGSGLLAAMPPDLSAEPASSTQFAQSGPAAPVALDIPAQALDSALTRFAEQADLKLLFASDEVAGLRSQALAGRYTPADALARLLGGSGLTYRFTSRDTVTIEKPDREGNSIQLAPLTVVGEGASSWSSTGYAPAPSSVATKLNLPIRETPYTINQVDAELLRDRGQDTIYEALENFAGVTNQSTNSDTGSNFARSIFVRGFDISGDGPILLNGQRTYTTGTNFRSTASMERIELLRGAAGIYYGASQPGGILNYVYKKPETVASRRIWARGDTFGSIGGTVDITGPIDEARTLSYRVVGDYTRRKENVDEIYEAPKSLMGALTWAPDPTFSSTLTFETLQVDGVPQRYDNIRVDGELLDVEDDIFWGYDNDYVDVTQYTALWENTWQPVEDVGLRSYLAYQTTEQDHQTTRIGGRGGGTPLADGSLPRTVHVGRADEESISTGLDLSGDFETFGFGHDWLLGYGFARGTSSGGVAQCSTGASPGDACYAIRPASQFPFDPIHNDYAFTDEIFDLVGTQRGGISKNIATDHNFYVQDLITLPNEDTKLLLGGGYTIAERISWNEPKGGVSTDPETVDARHFTPRFAITHDLFGDTTIYASYSESYYPQLYINPDGQALDEPEIGTQYEVGFKHDLFGGDALLTVAAFQLEKENVQRSDPNYDPDEGYRIADGLQRSRGVEFELTGRVTNWWDARVAYAYLDTEIVKSDANQGQPFEYISPHNLAVWNKIRLYGTPREGEFSVGFGINAYSSAETFDGEVNDAYAIADVGLFYERSFESGPAIQAALRVDNLFDKEYFDRRSYGSSVTYGQERFISFSLGIVF